jgi:ribbon-helix-helix CopG family protein
MADPRPVKTVATPGPWDTQASLKARPLPEAISCAEGKGLFLCPGANSKGRIANMPAQENQRGEAPRKRARKRTEKTILKNIISLRVSDREKKVLEKITESNAMSVSDVVREALEYWLARRQRLCRQA